jgi:hypothetical protein
MSEESVRDLFDRWERVWHEGQYDFVAECVAQDDRKAVRAHAGRDPMCPASSACRPMRRIYYVFTVDQQTEDMAEASGARHPTFSCRAAKAACTPPVAVTPGHLCKCGLCGRLVFLAAFCPVSCLEGVVTAIVY